MLQDEKRSHLPTLQISRPCNGKDLEEIEQLFAALQETFVDQAEFDDAVHAVAHLCDVFGVTKAGALSKSTKGYKEVVVGQGLQLDLSVYGSDCGARS